MALYDNGKYQSLSYQNDYSIGSNKKSKSTTLESGSDPLSQSLPAKNLKKMKKSESVENSSVKCVYDSRLFKMDEADDTEYLKAKRQDNNSFKDFLNASFNNERKTSKVSEKKINQFEFLMTCPAVVCAFTVTVELLTLPFELKTRYFSRLIQKMMIPALTVLTLKMIMNMRV